MSMAPVALVTGGARRVGRAIAIELARAGYDLAVHFRSSHAQADAAASEVRSLGRRCALVPADLNESSTWSGIVTKVIEELGRLDVLVNNASVFDPRRGGGARESPDFDPAQWEQMFRVNATAAAGLAYAARPYLASGGRGRIVNLCDISAEHPWPGYLSYCCSKAALVALTRGLAAAFAPHITVNGVSPGIAVFPDEYPPQLRTKLLAKVPLRREGTPEEVAQLVCFLAESGEYITGQIISIDGGRSLT